MKLKYYMRGLGIGIILTTLIIAIGNPKKEISDQEIKKRAEALGMVIKEESNENLEDIIASAGPTEAAVPSEEPKVTQAIISTPAPTLTPTAAPTPEPTKEPEPTAAPTPEPTKEPEPSKEPAPTKEPSADKNNVVSDRITFSIEKGMSSNMVSKLLATKGLIKDAEDFNQYILSVGKASVIRVGSYTLPEDASYEEIVDAITSR